MGFGLGFLSAGLKVIFDKLASPQGNLINMFQKQKNDVKLLKKLKITLLGLQAALSDAENKQASNPSVSEWLNELRHAVDSTENLIEEVNYEVLRVKVETGNQQVSDLNLCLSDDFFGNIKEKLEETIETLEDLQKQIGLLGLKEHLVSTKQETRKPSTSLVDESDVLGRESEIEDLIGRLLSEDANRKNLTVIPIVGMGGLGKTTLAKGNLTSLQRLEISFCNQLQSLAELALPSSLSLLYIEECPNLKSLQVKEMPSSLSTLCISNCPLVEAVIEYEKGEYWPNIAHIPTIIFDWNEYL